MEKAEVTVIQKLIYFTSEITLFITFTSLCNLDPSDPHFYMGVYIISAFYGFLVFLKEVLF